MTDLTEESTMADPDYEQPDEDISTYRNYQFYPQTIEMGMRYGWSDNQIANIHNSIMVDRGITDPAQLLSPSKVRKMKKQHVFTSMEQHKKNSGYKCLGVDGKISNVKVAGNKVEKLEKQTVICQVEKEFVGHFTPPNGEGASIAHGFFDVSTTCHQRMLQILISKYFRF